MNRYIATLLFVNVLISANCQISVTTNSALNITSTSATLNGSYDPKGNATQYTFRIWETNSSGSSISINGSLLAVTGSQYVTCSVVNLKPSTYYTYTLLVNQAGIFYSGNTVNFITACGPPQSITTKAATEITSNSATLNGESLVNGGCIATYSFTLFQTINGVAQQFDFQGASSYKVTGLMRNTTYSYRFNANLSGNVYHGNAVEFTTACEPPSIVTTKTATNIESRTAILQGNYEAGGCLTSYYYQYGTTINYELSTPVINSTNTGIQDVSFCIEHLTPNSTYHYRLVVTQQGNSYYGNDITITTPNETTAVDLYESNINSFTATNITSTGFKAKWDAVDGAELYNVSWKVDGATYSTAPQATSTNELDITGLLPNTKYYFRVQTRRNGQLGNWSLSSLKGFTTLPSNQKPTIPCSPIPTFNSHFIYSLSTNLNWTSVDPEGDQVHFDLYTGTSQSDLTKYASGTGTSYAYNANVEGDYFWKIISYDNAGNSSEGPVWYFTVGSNYALTNFPPTIPCNPFPENNSFWTSIHPTLSWRTSDPEGLAVKCELYLGTSSTNLNKVTTLSGTMPQFMAPLSNLLGNQMYYWKIIVSDPISPSVLIESPIWSFTTCEQNQSITFPSISNKIFGYIDFIAGASASSGLAITYSSSNSSVATIVNEKIHIVGAGDCYIYADQYGKAGYWSQAPQVSQSLIVNKADQSIDFTALPTLSFGSTDYALTASSTSGLAVAFSSNKPEVATIVDGKLRIVGAGECTIYANQVGNTNYNPAQQVSRILTVNQLPIKVEAISNQKVYGESDLPLTFKYSPSLINNDAFTGLLTRTLGENAGVYSIQQGTLSAGNNYSITFLGADFTITKKSLNVKAENKSKNYGDAKPDLTLSFEGFAYNDDKAVIDILPSINCSATQNSNSGSYPIELSGGSDNNYDLELENGTLQVNTILGVVSTSSIQSITSTTVDVYGELTNHGGEESIVRGFVYATTTNPTLLNSKVEAGTGVGSFSQAISGLTPNTKYYVRSYATNSVGTVYGNELFFTTLSTNVPIHESSEVTIYPNPTTGVVYFKGIDPKARIEIYNLNGTIIQSVELVNNQIDLKDIPDGTYIIKTISEGKIATFKIIKD